MPGIKPAIARSKVNGLTTRLPLIILLYYYANNYYKIDYYN